MNLALPIFLLLGGLIHSAVAEEKPIDGSIVFRGTVDGLTFRSSSFDIVVGDDALAITAKKNKLKFSIPIESQKLSDAVLSRNHQAAAVVLGGLPWPSRQQALVTVNAAGEKKVFEYKTYEMTKDLGWIVELGAVSDEGTLVLAKCAFMLPPREDGSEWVNHKWVILLVSDGALKVVETDAAIDKWSEISSVKKNSTEK